MRFYRLLARAFPPAFRRRYEAELAETAAELLQSQRSSGPLRRLKIWIGLTVDAVMRGLAERRAERAAAHPRASVGRSIGTEARQALRALAARPGFAVTIAGLLAITMGANTAVFGVVNATVLRPLPYADPERLVLLWESYPPMQLATMPWSDLDFLDVRAASSFDSAAIFHSRRVVLTGHGDAESLRATFVDGRMFGVLGIEAYRGRLLNESDSAAARQDIAMLSHASWRARFAGDPDIVGRSITLDHRPVTVVGVLPAGFSFPPPLTFNGRMLALEPEIYLPYTMDTRPDARGSHDAFAIARLKPGVSVETANAEVAAIGERVAREYRDTNTDMHMSATSLHAQSVLTIRTVLFVLLGAVGGVLLIACASIANLMLARASGRGPEMGLRASLGASRASLVRQLLFESAMLGLAGMGLGLLVALWISTTLVTLNPIQLPAMFETAFDWRVLSFTGGLTLAAVFIFGLLPALKGSRTDLSAMFQSGGRTSGLPAERRMKTVLAVVQVAVALVLLVGSGLALRSLIRLWSIDPGFQPNGVATVGLTLPETLYDTDALQRRFEERLRGKLRQVPGVTRVSTSTMVPFGPELHSGDYTVVGLPPRKTGDYLIAAYQRTSPDYLDALGLRILEGRGFWDADRDGAPLVALVSESLARRHWPAGQAVGHQLLVEGDPGEVPKTIVGVVRDVRMEGFNGKIMPTIYLPISQSPTPSFWAIVTSARAAEQLSSDIRAAVREIDPAVPVGSVRALVDIMGDTVKTPRFTAIVLSAFAGTALLIAAIGLYGILAFDALQRRRELGVRVALGATPGSIRRLLVARGLRIVSVGVLLGAAAALAATRLLAGLFVEAPRSDAVAFTAATTVLTITTLVATWLPARRATRTDPVEALRTQ